MIVAIAAAEVAFWVVLGAGLLSRYVLRRPGLSRVLLLCVPLVDVLLLAFVVIDIAAGAPPSQGHALAAIYLGVTVMFGHSMVAWADVRFRHRFAGGPAPVKPAKGSRDAVRALWVEWFRVVGAVAIAAVLVLGMIAVRGVGVPDGLDAASKDPYWGSLTLMAVVTAIWFLAGPAFAGRGRADALTPR
ncbi:hypothetical protein GCM10011519_00070 [Marmoricola endophyticus]|uniref:Uncharacterized protein n=1 Tax=Marmoricola endophyticus TaxID=2040280 RepID=A0A917B8Z9_9ACTN|nr:hypothetical protein [Marmoricola endophyticus]GGF30635.1 hypothetical protein GCM10011519_00070 [Marmoricola endophyticus]